MKREEKKIKKQRETDRLKSVQSRKVSKSQQETASQRKIEEFKVQIKPYVQGSPTNSCTKIQQENLATPQSKISQMTTNRKLNFSNPFARFDPFHAALHSSGQRTFHSQPENSPSKVWQPTGILFPSALKLPLFPTGTNGLHSSSENITERKPSVSQAPDLLSVETQLFKGNRLTFSPVHSE